MDTTAMILELVKQKGDNVLSGRTALQKLVYFTKVYGRMSSPRFRMYIYGPFSDDVANALQDCVFEMLLIENNGIRRDEEFDSACSYHKDNMDRVSSFVAEALGSFGNMETKELELVATTHFVFSQQRHLYQEEYDKENVCEKVKLLKGTKFQDKEIDEAYSKLSNLHLLA